MQRNHTTILAGTTLALLALVLLSLSQYNWNVSAFLRIDQEFGKHFRVPAGTVLFEDGGYDGMLYYQIARDLPEILSREDALGRYENAYRLQRILLPFLAFALSHGNEDVLPTTILIINISAVIGSLALALFYVQRTTLHALALIFNPAALVGILFSLTEPLVLFLTTAFLLLFLKQGQRLNAPQLILLVLAMFARETTIVLIALLLLFYTLKREGRQALLSLTSLLPFALWELFLTLKLGTVPFAAGSAMLNLPLSGSLNLLLRSLTSPNAYLLSSLSFLLLFILPLLCYLLNKLWRERTQGQFSIFHSASSSWPRGNFQFSIMEFFLAGLTAILLLLDAHIWGAITSVGRVVPALYPVYSLWALEHDTLFTRALSLSLIVVSSVTALGIALTSHPFTIS